MNERTRRMQRLVRLAEKQEQRSRQVLGQALADQDDAAHALQSVFLQCREVARRPDEFSVRFGRGLIEAGWLAERERRTQLEAAADIVDVRRSDWQREQTRVDALERLLDRLSEAEAAEASRKAENELGDRISARHSRTMTGAA